MIMYKKVNATSDNFKNVDHYYQEFLAEEVLGFKVKFGYQKPYLELSVLEALFKKTTQSLFIDKYFYIKSKRDNRFKYLQAVLELTTLAVIENAPYLILLDGKLSLDTPDIFLYKDESEISLPYAFKMKVAFTDAFKYFGNQQDMQIFTTIFKESYGLKNFNNKTYLKWLVGNIKKGDLRDYINTNFGKEFQQYLGKHSESQALETKGTRYEESDADLEEYVNQVYIENSDSWYPLQPEDDEAWGVR